MSNPRQIPVKEVEACSRPIEDPILSAGGLKHYGVRATLEDGQQYLIHNTPSASVSFTPANNMSSNWQCEKPMAAAEGVTIQSMMNNSTAPVINFPLLSESYQKVSNYADSGTCIVASKRALNHAVTGDRSIVGLFRDVVNNVADKLNSLAEDLKPKENSPKKETEKNEIEKNETESPKNEINSQVAIQE